MLLNICITYWTSSSTTPYIIHLNPLVNNANPMRPCVLYAGFDETIMLSF